MKQYSDSKLYGEIVRVALENPLVLQANSTDAKLKNEALSLILQ